jgi:hypothetical protein
MCHNSYLLLYKNHCHDLEPNIIATRSIVVQKNIKNRNSPVFLLENGSEMGILVKYAEIADRPSKDYAPVQTDFINVLPG